MASGVLSQDKLDRRKIVGINAETVSNVTSTDFPGHYPGEDHVWSLEKFANNLDVKFHRNDRLKASFSLIGIDASIANALRRILLAEVPTIAIEYVFVEMNTSVIADEVISHRLGLVPLKGSIEGLKWMQWYHPPEDPNAEDQGKHDYDTISMSLKAKCERNPDADKNETDPRKKYIGSNVYARDLAWRPNGQQGEKFKEGPIEPVHPDILIAKLRPGQEIEMSLHAVKGKGMDHAKFSPVGTATYRLLPIITITKPILGQDAKTFQKCFPRGVIDLERVTAADAVSNNTAYHGREGDEKAVVKNVFKDTVSRECLRHGEFDGKVKLGRVQDHFIFDLESTGQFPSDMLFLDSLGILKQKAMRLKKALDKTETS